MQRMDRKEQLRAIVAKDSLTKADKDLVVELCEELGVPKPANTRCKDCWKDTAIACYKALAKDEPRKGVRLQEWVDVLVDGVRVNNATLEDEMVEYLKDKLPAHYWAYDDNSED